MTVPSEEPQWYMLLDVILWFYPYKSIANQSPFLFYFTLRLIFYWHSPYLFFYSLLIIPRLFSHWRKPYVFFYSLSRMPVYLTPVALYIPLLENKFTNQCVLPLLELIMLNNWCNVQFMVIVMIDIFWFSIHVVFNNSFMNFYE